MVWGGREVYLGSDLGAPHSLFRERKSFLYHYGAEAGRAGFRPSSATISSVIAKPSFFICKMEPIIFSLFQVYLNNEHAGKAQHAILTFLCRAFSAQ